MKPFKLCFVGAGSFANCFIPLFQAHPLVREVSLCDTNPESLAQAARIFGVSRCFASMDEVLRSDVDAVAIFTQRWTHAPLALRALAAGKHVYSAVPAAMTLEELHELIEAVKRTGLVYMMGETSYYYGSRLFCREKWDAGAFGHFVYGEGEYYHDMSHGFYSVFQRGGADWKSTASVPPMLYPTHSTAMILSVTGARMTSVSCLGWKDRSDDGVFVPEISRWGNAFSNQTALFRTSDGGMARINEFRRVGTKGGRSVRLSLFGTEGSFQEDAAGAQWSTRETDAVVVEDQVRCSGIDTPEEWEALKVEVELRGDFAAGFAAVHQMYRARLPDAFRTRQNGHEGSHQFLTDDFARAVAGGTLPPVNVWEAAKYNAPGIVAHESSKRDGEVLPVPDFGAPAQNTA